MDPQLLPLTGATGTELDGHRLHLLRPQEIADRLRERSVVYIPIGTLEWHSWHLPIGLDALNAEGICLRAAVAGGGLVLPTLYYGTGGSHAAFPWSIIPASGAEIGALIRQTLGRLDDLGVELAVIFTGHFAPEQVALVIETVRDWNAGAHRLVALGLSVHDVQGAAIAPDHAGRFEATLLHALHPDLVTLERLGDPRPDEVGEDPWGAQRYDPAHSLWGVVGPDPRTMRPEEGPPLLEACVRWILGEVAAAMAPLAARGDDAS